MTTEGSKFPDAFNSYVGVFSYTSSVDAAEKNVKNFNLDRDAYESRLMVSYLIARFICVYVAGTALGDRLWPTIQHIAVSAAPYIYGQIQDISFLAEFVVNHCALSTNTFFLCNPDMSNSIDLEVENACGGKYDECINVENLLFEKFGRKLSKTTTSTSTLYEHNPISKNDKKGVFFKIHHADRFHSNLVKQKHETIKKEHVAYNKERTAAGSNLSLSYAVTQTNQEIQPISIQNAFDHVIDGLYSSANEMSLKVPNDYILSCQAMSQYHISFFINLLSGATLTLDELVSRHWMVKAVRIFEGLQRQWHDVESSKLRLGLINKYFPKSYEAINIKNTNVQAGFEGTLPQFDDHVSGYIVAYALKMSDLTTDKRFYISPRDLLLMLYKAKNAKENNEPATGVITSTSTLKKETSYFTNIIDTKINVEPEHNNDTLVCYVSRPDTDVRKYPKTFTCKVHLLLRCEEKKYENVLYNGNSKTFLTTLTNYLRHSLDARIPLVVGGVSLKTINPSKDSATYYKSTGFISMFDTYTRVGLLKKWGKDDTNIFSQTNTFLVLNDRNDKVLDSYMLLDYFLETYSQHFMPGMMTKMIEMDYSKTANCKLFDSNKNLKLPQKETKQLQQFVKRMSIMFVTRHDIFKPNPPPQPPPPPPLYMLDDKDILSFKRSDDGDTELRYVNNNNRTATHVLKTSGYPWYDASHYSDRLGVCFDIVSRMCIDVTHSYSDYVIFGFGGSGVGKTSLLLTGIPMGTSNEDRTSETIFSMICDAFPLNHECCDKNGRTIMIQATEFFVSSQELKIKSEDYGSKELNNNTGSTVLKDFIYEIDNRRQQTNKELKFPTILRTQNNDQSSRSVMVYHVTITYGSKEKCHLHLVDLPGYELKGTIMEKSKHYDKKNYRMTFNENSEGIRQLVDGACNFCASGYTISEDTGHCFRYIISHIEKSRGENLYNGIKKKVTYFNIMVYNNVSYSNNKTACRAVASSKLHFGASDFHRVILRNIEEKNKRNEKDPHVIDLVPWDKEGIDTNSWNFLWMRWFALCPDIEKDFSKFLTDFAKKQYNTSQVDQTHVFQKLFGS